MKKALVAIAIVSAAVFAAQAEMLYWMVDSSSTKYSAADSVNYAQFYAWDGSQMNLLSGSSDLTSVHEFNTSSKTGIDYQSATYWVEVASYDESAGTYVADSYYGGFSYSQLNLSATALSSSTAQINALKAAWSGSNVARRSGSVPEPTSGLMMLVGMALLGLKRRRA